MRFKGMTDIYSRMVDHTITTTNKINDFSTGSAMRSIYEAVSIELEQFYVLTQENIEEAIEQGVYSSFEFTRTPSVRAYGTVNIYFHNATQSEMYLPRGSRFMSNQSEYPQIYETVEDYRIPQGSLRSEVEVHAQAPGSLGNVPQGVINVMKSPIANINRVENSQAIQTGQDEEPLSELRARFRSYIRSLSKATIPALEYGTREVEEVTGVYIEEQAGLVKVHAHDRNGNLPDFVKEKIEGNLEEYRPSGVKVEVLPVTRTDVDVEATVTLTNRSAITNRLRTSIERSIENYLDSMTTSEDLILSDLTRVIMNLDRQLIYDVSFTHITDNKDIKGSEIIRAGNVTVKLK